MNKNLKKRLLLLFVLLFLIGVMWVLKKPREGRELEIFYQTPQEGEASFYLSPETESYSLKQTFTVEVKLATVEQTKVVIPTAVLNFDPARLQIISLEGNQADFATQILLDYDNSAGIITIKQGVGGGAPAVSGEILLGTIEFQAVNEGVTSVSFDQDESRAVSNQVQDLVKKFSPGAYQIERPRGTLSVRPNQKEIDLSETFESLIKLNSAEGIVVSTTVINFNSDLLQVVSLTPNQTDFASQMLLDYDNSTGTITIKQGLGGSQPAVSGEILLGTIEFQAISSGTAGISFNQSESSAAHEWEGFLDLDFLSASYNINAPSPSPSPSLSPSPSPPPSPSPSSSPSPSPSPSPYCVRFSQGDANCNDIIGDLDYALWWQSYRVDQDGDFNDDGITEDLDYAIWWLNWEGGEV